MSLGAWAVPVAVVAVLAAASLLHGGFYADDLRWIEWAVVGILGVAFLAVVFRRQPLVRVWGAPTVGCALVAAVVAASAGAGPGIEAALPVVGVLTVLAAITIVVSALTTWERDVVLYGFALTAVVLTVIGISAVAWHHEPLATFDRGVWRAASTLWYPNVLATVVAAAVFVPLARLVYEPARITDRVVCQALLAGLIATWSRGGAFAFVGGLAVFAAVVGISRAVTVIWPHVVATGVFVALFIPASNGTVANAWMAPLGLGVACLLAPAVARFARRTRRLPVMLGGAVSVVGAAAVVGAPGVRASLTAGSLGDRMDIWRDAAATIQQVPWLGTGPGNVIFVYRNEEGIPLLARYAHNEYLGMAVEHGLVGLLVLSLVLGGLAHVVWSARHSSPPVHWVAAVAGLTTIGVHSALDFLWRFPVVPMVGAVLVAVVLRHDTEVGGADAGRSGDEPLRHGRSPRDPGDRSRNPVNAVVRMEGAEA